MRPFTGFIGPSYELDSVNAEAQRCVNLYPEMIETGTGKEVARLVARPGLARLATLGSGPVRALYYSSRGRSFAVSGAEVYEVTNPESPVVIGALTTTQGRAGMTDNGIDLVVVDGARGYRFTFSTNAWAEITDPEFPAGADQAQFLDQYILVNEPGTGRFWWSALLDAANWDGLDFVTVEGAPDNLLTFLVDHREIWLFGDRSIEVFYNTGDADTPFQRLQGSYIEEGAVAGSVQKLDNTIFYVSRTERGDPIVKRAQAYQPQRISTHAIEAAIASYGDVRNASSWAYQASGHSFYGLLFPGADRTWVFDAATGLWHERTWTRPDGTGQEQDRMAHHIYDGLRHLAGDRENGNLYELSDTAYTDDGAPITRMRRSPHISANGHRVFLSALQLDIESGVGLATGQGSDPQVMLRWSDDGGHNWSHERWASMGKQGETRQRALWRRLGSGRDRVFEVASTEPVKQSWIAAWIEAEGGAH